MRARDVATVWGDWANEMADMFDSLVDTMTPQERRRRHRPQRTDRRDGCGDCSPDTCHCDCCVYDADLVVYTRLHERRVVPIRISNERTRERTITLDLSDFRTGGGRPAPITAAIVTPKEFTLGACEHQDAILVLGVGIDADGNVGNVEKTGVEAPSLIAIAQPGDVDDCVVAYADLRIQGCDVRPVRVAVAIVPRDCDVHEVHCVCGCC